MIRQQSRRHRLSQHRLSQHRRGVSILEVLFAILIAAIGLMGAIAVFPAALMQTKRGQQADATAAAGHTAYHTFDAMGMRRADKWLVRNGTNYTVANQLDGSIAYCIDPRFMQANTNDNKANTFPYDSSFSRMLRVNLSNGAGGTTAMTALQANLVFGIEDDLAYDRFTGTFNTVDQSTQHAASLFAKDASNNPLKRESHGHMSWMATLSPKIERLDTGGTVEDRYVLSIVVFYDRPLQASGGYDVNEWELSIPTMYGSGIGGGDMQLSLGTNSFSDEEKLRRLTLHRDQWIMLLGNPTATTGGRQMTICRWYRVIDADDPNGNTVDVTLAGADWEVPTGQTRAAICQGVVAVFEKTITLEPRY